MKRNVGYDYLAKVLIIGDSGVGKTNILLRFCENSFLTSHLSTIGTSLLTQALTSKSKQSRSKVRRFVFKSGIQLARSVSRPSLRPIIRALWG